MDDLMAEWKSLDVNAPKAQGRDQAGVQTGDQYDFSYTGGSGGNNLSYFNYPPVGAGVGRPGSGTEGRMGATAYGTGSGYNTNQMSGGAIVDVNSQHEDTSVERASAAVRGMQGFMQGHKFVAKGASRRE